MEKIISTSLLLMGLMINTINANGNPEVFVRSGNSEEKIIRVMFNNIDEVLKVKIKDKNGIQLYSETVTKKQFEKKFTFNSAPTGIYRIEIEGTSRIWNYSLISDQNKVSIVENESSVFYKPKLILKNKKLSISKFATEKEEIEVVLTDIHGVALYHEAYDKDLYYRRNLDLRQLPKGDYNLKIASNGKNFYRNIEIK